MHSRRARATGLSTQKMEDGAITSCAGARGGGLAWSAPGSPWSVLAGAGAPGTQQSTPWAHPGQGHAEHRNVQCWGCPGEVSAGPHPDSSRTLVAAHLCTTVCAGRLNWPGRQVCLTGVPPQTEGPGHGLRRPACLLSVLGVPSSPGYRQMDQSCQGGLPVAVTLDMAGAGQGFPLYPQPRLPPHLRLTR